MKKYILLLLISVFLFTHYSLMSENVKGLKKINKISGNEGKRWAICVGINDYEDENIGDLKKAQNDALSLGKVLSDKGQFDKVITMINDYDHFQNKLLPTKLNIMKKLDFVLEFAKPEDLIVFFFSGHGISDDSGDGYLITMDTQLADKFETAIKVNDVVRKLKEKNIKKTLIMLDACREEITQTKGLGAGSGLKAREFQESEVAAAFYSTKSGWFSYEDTDSDYGVFTRFVMEGLDGQADQNGDKIVTFSELEVYVQDSVNEYSIQNDRKQKPYTKIYGEKFGDLALTAYINKKGIQSSPDNGSGMAPGQISSFKAALKFENEYDTVILSWVPPEKSAYDGFVILRQEKNEITMELENKLLYVPGEKIADPGTVVVANLDEKVFSYTDTGLKEGTDYHYKIFAKSNNNGFPLYSQTGLQQSVKTKINLVKLKVNLDSIEVLEVYENTWGLELYWKIEIVTSQGDRYILNERKKENYRALMAENSINFKHEEYIEFEMPKRDDGYFEIIVDMRERDDVKDGWVVENMGENLLINRKAYRYNLKDAITGQHSIEEEEKASGKVRIKWTISNITE